MQLPVTTRACPTGGRWRLLSDRLSKWLDSCDPVWRNEISPVASELLPPFVWAKTKPEIAFQFGVLGRMIFSCLIDSDRRDTEALYARTEGRSVGRTWDPLPKIVDGLIAAFDPTP
jgi:CRISPR-associated endonuclease/helicase Cas3